MCREFVQDPYDICSRLPEDNTVVYKSTKRKPFKQKKIINTSSFMCMSLLIYTAPNDVPFCLWSGKPRPLKQKVRIAHAGTLWGSQNCGCVLWFILNEMSITLLPLHVLYHGESQKIVISRALCWSLLLIGWTGRAATSTSFTPIVNVNVGEMWGSQSGIADRLTLLGYYAVSASK
jgi:hypothetical protein